MDLTFFEKGRSMKRKLMFLFLIVFLLNGIIGGICFTTYASDWPMARHDPQCTSWNKATYRLYPPFETLWEVDVPYYYVDGMSVAGGNIYLSGMGISGENAVYGLTAEGLIAWSYSLNYGGVGAMEVPPAYGGDAVFFGGQYDDRLYAVESETGTTLWSLPGMQGMYFSPPIVSDNIVYAFGKSGVVAVDSATGQLYWSSATLGSRGKLAKWDNTLFASSWYTSPTAIDTTTGTLIWTRSDIPTLMSDIVAYENRGYVGSNGNVYSLNLKNGDTIWTTPLPVEPFIGVGDYAFAFADDTLFVSGGARATASHPSPKKTLVALDPETGTQFWSCELSAFWTISGVANGVLFAERVEDYGDSMWETWEIVALDTQTGRELWQWDPPDCDSCTSAIANELLYIACPGKAKSRVMALKSSNELEDTKEIVISQSPLSGHCGTTFVQQGRGFKPNSTATLHFLKPDGTEYPTQQIPINEVGRFKIEYKVPSDKIDGVYTWWAVDGESRGKSNEITYTIDNGRTIVAGNPELANIRTGADEFQLWLDISVDGAKPNGFCENYGVDVVADGMPVFQTGCSLIGSGEIPNSTRYRVEFQIQSSENSNAAFFENGKVYIYDLDNTANRIAIDELDGISVYGSTFDITLHAWRFRNGDWLKPSAFGILESFTDDFYQAANIVSSYLNDDQKSQFNKHIGRFFSGGVFDRTAIGCCYGLTTSALCNFNHSGEAWGAGDLDVWENEIVNHWPGEEVVGPYKPFNAETIWSDAETFSPETRWTVQSAKKIMYQQVAQYCYRGGRNWVGNDSIVDWDNAELDITTKNKSGVVDLLKEGTPVAIGFKADIGGKTGGHAVAIVQKIEWNNRDKYIIWDNNFPWGSAPEGYGPYLEWYIENSSDYDFSLDHNEGTKFVRYIDEDNGRGCFIDGEMKYELKWWPQYLKNDGDSQNIYGSKNTRSYTSGSRKSVKQNSENDPIAIDHPDHIEIQIIGAEIDEIVRVDSGLPVTLIPHGDLIAGQASMETQMGGIFHFIYLPVEETYRIEASKYVDFSNLEVFVTIPNEDGTVQKINYEEVATAPEDATLIEFTVGRNNPDKDIRRDVPTDSKTKTTDSYEPNYDESSPIELEPPQNFYGIFDNGTARLSWINPSHPNFKNVRIVRKEMGLPEFFEDGTLVYEGVGGQFADLSTSKDMYYGYAAYCVDANANISKAAYATIVPYHFSIYGQVTTTAGEPLAGSEIVIKDPEGRIVDTDNSGSNGKYCLSNLQMNYYSVEAFHPSHQIIYPVRAVTLSDVNIVENFEALPAPTLTLLFDLKKIVVGSILPINWAYNNIGNDEVVDIQLFRSGNWETIASKVPIATGQMDWLVKGDAAEDAVLKLSLRSDPSVFDEFEFGVSALCRYLYFPYVICGNGYISEIGIINKNQNDSLEGVLKAYDEKGTMLSEFPIQLEVEGRIEFSVGDTFKFSQSIRYIVLHATHADSTGYTKICNDGKYRVALPAFSDTEINSSDIHVSHIASTNTAPKWTTTLSLLNTSKDKRAVEITFNTGEKKTIILEPNQFKAFTIADLFGGVPKPEITSASIAKADGCIGVELFCNEINNILSGIPLKDDLTNQMYFPHIAIKDGWGTGVVAYNSSPDDIKLTVTPYDEIGNALGSVTETISGRKRYFGVVSKLDLPDETAWIDVKTDAKVLTGFELFTQKNQMAGYTGVDIYGQVGVFPKVKSTEHTGIAFVNIDEGTATVNLVAYADSGKTIASQSMSLNKHEKFVDLAKNIFTADISKATYIKYSSDKNIVGFQLNLSDDLMMLDGLPAQ